MVAFQREHGRTDGLQSFSDSHKLQLMSIETLIVHFGSHMI